MRLNEEHFGLILRDSNLFVTFCFGPSTGYYFMPWYLSQPHCSFVFLPDQLDVIDLNTAVTSGAYVIQLSATAHSGAASRGLMSESDSSSSNESSDSSSLAGDARGTRTSSSSSSSTTRSFDDTPSAAVSSVGKTRGEKKAKRNQENKVCSSAKHSPAFAVTLM